MAPITNTLSASAVSLSGGSPVSDNTVNAILVGLGVTVMGIIAFAIIACIRSRRSYSEDLEAQDKQTTPSRAHALSSVIGNVNKPSIAVVAQECSSRIKTSDLSRFLVNLMSLVPAGLPKVPSRNEEHAEVHEAEPKSVIDGDVQVNPGLAYINSLLAMPPPPADGVHSGNAPASEGAAPVAPIDTSQSMDITDGLSADETKESWPRGCLSMFLEYLREGMDGREAMAKAYGPRIVIHKCEPITSSPSEESDISDGLSILSEELTAPAKGVFPADLMEAKDSRVEHLQVPAMSWTTPHEIETSPPAANISNVSGEKFTLAAPPRRMKGGKSRPDVLSQPLAF